MRGWVELITEDWKWCVLGFRDFSQKWGYLRQLKAGGLDWNPIPNSIVLGHTFHTLPASTWRPISLSNYTYDWANNPTHTLLTWAYRGYPKYK